MTCARCHYPICGYPDAIYAGTVIIDDASDPGSWARHIRDTACMRDVPPAPKQATSGADTQHGRAHFVVGAGVTSRFDGEYVRHGGADKPLVS